MLDERLDGDSSEGMQCNNFCVEEFGATMEIRCTKCLSRLLQKDDVVLRCDIPTKAERCSTSNMNVVRVTRRLFLPLYSPDASSPHRFDG